MLDTVGKIRHSTFLTRPVLIAWSVTSRPAPIKNFHPELDTQLPSRRYSKGIKNSTTHLTGIKLPKALGAQPEKIAVPAIFRVVGATVSNTETSIHL